MTTNLLSGTQHLLSSNHMMPYLHEIESLFGSTVLVVLKKLLTRRWLPLKLLSHCDGADKPISFHDIKRVLIVLCHHNLCRFRSGIRNTVEYDACPENIVPILHRPLYEGLFRQTKQTLKSLLMNAMLNNGRMTFEELQKHSNESAKQSNIDTDASIIESAFRELVNDHIFMRCPQPDMNSSNKLIPHLLSIEKLAFTLPSSENSSTKSKVQIKTESALRVDKKRGRIIEDDDGDVEMPAQKKRKTSESEFDAISIYWLLCFPELNKLILNQFISEAIKNRYGERFSRVADALLSIFSEKSTMPHKTASHSTFVSGLEIVEKLSRGPTEDIGLSTKRQVDQYLSVLSLDSTGAITKAGDQSGGIYTVDYNKALEALTVAHIESVLQERFGSKAIRMFRLIMTKRHLEEREIEKFCMMPSKDAKFLLYTLVAEEFISITEISKAKDYAPSRTFYLFSVNIPRVASVLLERCSKSLLNLKLRQDYEKKSDSRLLEKEKRIDGIVASLRATETPQERIDEIDEMLTAAERSELLNIHRKIRKLQLAEIQLLETMFVLQAYLGILRIY